MSSKDYHRLIVQTRAPWRPGSGSATPGAHGCGGAATARVLALICPPALGGLDGQLWCPACLQVTLRCSKTSLSSLTSGILERVPFFSSPIQKSPLLMSLLSRCSLTSRRRQSSRLHMLLKRPPPRKASGEMGSGTKWSLHQNRRLLWC